MGYGHRRVSVGKMGMCENVNGNRVENASVKEGEMGRVNTDVDGGRTRTRTRGGDQM